MTVQEPLAKRMEFILEFSLHLLPLHNSHDCGHPDKLKRKELIIIIIKSILKLEKENRTSILS